jgi:hypothetical protein
MAATWCCGVETALLSASLSALSASCIAHTTVVVETQTDNNFDTLRTQINLYIASYAIREHYSETFLRS